MIYKLPFGIKYPNKFNAVFIALTVKSKIYSEHPHYKMSDVQRDKSYPLVLMVNRWDGGLGFPGGFVEPNETLYEAALRELEEETGIPKYWINNGDYKEGFGSLEPICSHELKDIIAHFYQFDVGEKHTQWPRSALRMTADAKHCISEGTPTWIHLEDYGSEKGLSKLLNNNSLKTGVKEEIEELLKRL